MAPWPSRRIAAAAASIALGAAGGVWSVAVGPDALWLLVTLALCSLTAGVVIRRESLVATGAALLGLTYVLGRVGNPVELVSPIVFGEGLFVMLELALWSMELSEPVTWEHPVTRLHMRHIAGIAIVGIAAALIVGLAGVAGRGSGSALALVGAAAAPALVWSLVALIRRAATAT